MNKYFLILTIMAVVTLGFTFYWFELRPSQIIKNCIQRYPHAFKDELSLGRLGKTDKEGYDRCLREGGLMK